MDFDVDWNTNGSEALVLFRANSTVYDILMIDVRLPEMDGFDFAQQVLKINPKVSFLFLTAKNEKQDKLYGSKIGANDYFTKPFEIDEVVLRIKNILKRQLANTSLPSPRETVIWAGHLHFYKAQLKLVLDNQKETLLTGRESEMLDYLFHHPNCVFKREQIVSQLWGENDYFLGRSLDVFISRLRKYFGNNDQVNITNIYGVGFKFKKNYPVEKTTVSS